MSVFVLLIFRDLHYVVSKKPQNTPQNTCFWLKNFVSLQRNRLNEILICYGKDVDSVL